MINGYNFDSNTMINGKIDFDDISSQLKMMDSPMFSSLVRSVLFSSVLFSSLHLFVQFCSLVHSLRFFNYARGNEEKWKGRDLNASALSSKLVLYCILAINCKFKFN